MIALTLLALSCVGSGPIVGPRSVSQGDLRARLALGALSDELQGQEQEQARLMRIAQVARALGNHEESFAACEQMMHKATNALAVATAQSDTEAIEQATIAMEAAQRFTLSMAKALKNPSLVLSALGTDPSPRFKSSFIEAVLAERWVSERAGDAAVDLAGDDIATRIALRIASGSEIDENTSVEHLVAAGPSAFSSLQQRWTKIADSTDGSAVRAISASALEADPLFLPARLAQLYWDDIDAGRIKAETDIAESVLGTEIGGTPVIRLQRAHEANPAAESLSLGFVHQLYRSGLTGDAYVKLRDLRAKGLSSKAAKGIADQLGAFLSLRAGDVHGYRFWAKAKNAAASPYMTQVEMRFSASERQTVWTDLVREARIRAFKMGIDRSGSWWRNRTLAANPKVPNKIRRDIITTMRGYDRNGSVIARHCLETAADYESCDRLYDDADELSEDEGLSDAPVDMLRRISKVRDLSPSLLWTFSGIDQDEAKKMRPLLGRLEDTSLAASDAYVAIRLQAYIASGDAAAAAAFLAESGALLSAGARLAYRLAIDDLQAGKADIKQALTAVAHRYERYDRNDLGTEADEVEWIAKEYPGDGKAAAYIRGRSYWNAGHPDQAVSEWKPLLDATNDDAHFLGFLALAAHEAGDTDVLSSAKALLGKHNGATRLRAQLALATAATTSELGALRRVLYKSDHALLRFLEAVCKQHPKSDGLALVRAFFATSAPNLDWKRSWLGDGVKNKWLESGEDAARLIAVAATTKPGELISALGPAALADEDLAEKASAHAYEAIAEAKDGIQARAIASKAVGSLADSAEFSSRRNRLAWLYLLAGNGERALNVATDGDPDEAYGEDAKIVMAAKEQIANPSTISAELAWTLWQHVERSEEAVLDVAQELTDRSTLADGGLTLGCRLLINADFQDEALRPCMLAWQKGGTTGDLAAAVSYLMVNRAPQAKALGFDDQAFFSEVPKRLPASADTTWRQNYSIWLSGKDRHGDAAKQANEAWASGTSWDSRPNSSELKQALDRGLGLRRQAYSGYRGGLHGRSILMAFIALLEGKVDVAHYYVLQRGADAWRPIDSELARVDSLVLGATAMARQDIAAGKVDPAGVGLWLRGISDLGEASDSAKFAAGYSSSLLYLLLRAEDDELPIEERLRLAKKLDAASPGNLLVLVDLLHLLVANKNYPEARKAMTSALAHHPGHEVLTSIVVPSEEAKDSLGGSVAALSSHAEFTKALAKVSTAQIEALGPERYVNSKEATSAYAPKSATLTQMAGMTLVTESGVRLVARSFPRAAMCEGLDCMAGMKEGLEKQGFRELWRGTVSLPAGPGAELLMDSEGGYLHTTVVPVGGRLFALYFAGPHGAVSKSLAELRLWRDSFRPMDRWMPAPAAEALRTRTLYNRNDAANLNARVQIDQAGTKPGCPIQTTLAGIEYDEEKAQVLLESVLDASTQRQRQQLFACAAPKDPAAARLGVLALLSEDRQEYQYGVSVAEAFPDETSADAIAALLVEDVTALSATARETGAANLAPFGILQALAALPKKQRQQVAGQMLRTNSTRNRSLTLMAAGIVDEAMPSDLLRLQIRNSPANAAALAVRAAFFDMPDKEIIAATRRRLDTMKAPLDAAQRALLAASVGALVPLVDRTDVPRLKRAEAIAGDAKEPGEDAQDKARSLKAFVLRERERHQRALELRAKKRSADIELDQADASAQALVDALDATGATAKPTLSDERLAKAPLPELLAGPLWNYVRVQQPGLFVATLQGLYRRLQGASKLDSVMLRRIGTGMAAHMGLEIFGEKGGLDLSKPLECATPGNLDYGFVCSVYVTDARRVREHLVRRRLGSDTSLALAMQLAQGGIMAPLLVVGAPLFLHTLIRDSSKDGSSKAKVVAEERLRTTETVAGRQVERMLIAQANEDGHSVFDSEYYLFVGDRLLAFSSRGLAEGLLGADPTKRESLQNNAEFGRATSSWKDGAALQAFMLAGTGATFDEATGLEIFADGEGLRVRVPVGQREEFVDAADTATLIPGTPISQFSFGAGSSKAKSDEEREDIFGSYDEKVLGSAPPMWLFKHVKRGSFAWYSPTEGKLWDEWLAVVEANANIRRALRKNRVRLPKPGALSEVDGLTYSQHGKLLLVSSTGARARAALAVASSAVDSKPIFLSGSFDGKTSAAAIRAMGAKARSDLKNTLNIFAVYSGAIDSAKFSISIRQEGGRPVFEGQLLPRLAEEGIDLNAVDQWLASPRIRNSATLPRAVTERDLQRPLTLLIEIDEAPEAFASSFAGMPRITAKVADATHVRVTIEPGARPSQSIEPAALSVAQRKELLSSTGLLNTRHPRIKKLATEIVAKESEPRAAADAILKWIETNVAYEITPRAVDAIDVLDKKRGDCTEYSVLAVSLLRASGIPAELRQGMAVQKAEMVAHNWIAYHDGTGWREVDPTFGTAYVSSGHIEASLLEFVSLISVGGLKIVDVESGKAP